MAVSYVTSRVLDTYPGLDPTYVEAHFSYFSLVSLRDRFVYMMVPKAACTSIKSLLRGLYDPRPLELFKGRETRREMFIHALGNAPLPSLNALDRVQQQELLDAPDVFRFAIVRNPYTRLLSAWRDKVFLCEPGFEDIYTAVRGSPPTLDRHKRPVEFAEFVSFIENSRARAFDSHWRRQVDMIFPKAVSYTHIGKTEELNSILESFSRHLGRLESLSAPRINEGSIKPPANFSKQLADRIVAVYEEDFITFGYDPNSWPDDDLQGCSSAVSQERFVDEMIERNLIISHLYKEISRRPKYSIMRRILPAALRNRLRRIFDERRELTVGASHKIRPF
jgi:hypothetical protein